MEQFQCRATQRSGYSDRLSCRLRQPAAPAPPTRLPPGDQSSAAPADLWSNCECANLISAPEKGALLHVEPTGGLMDLMTQKITEAVHESVCIHTNSNVGVCARLPRPALPVSMTTGADVIRSPHILNHIFPT